ncbi:hypothetical protein D3C72_2077610 [compost metagenome]
MIIAPAAAAKAIMPIHVVTPSKTRLLEKAVFPAPPKTTKRPIAITIPIKA